MADGLRRKIPPKNTSYIVVLERNSMKVYYVGNRWDGCYYVRCLLPLQANGWDGYLRALGGERDTAEQMVEKIMKADIVVFQRPDQKDKTEMIRILRENGKKVVFDNDDTYKPDSGFPKLDIRENREMVNKVNEELYNNVRQADLVTTTTVALAEEYRALNKNVVVLPNCIDPFDIPEPKRNEGKKVRIGLTGSVGYDDFKIILPYLKELSERDDVQLVFFSLSLPELTHKRVRDLYKESYDFVKSANIEWHTHVPMAQYFEKLNDLELDLMLIPRRETYFNKCKSNLKFLEAGALEIPVIASSFPDKDSPYDKDLNGENGFLAKDEAEFRLYTEKLIKDKELRRKVGKNAREYVYENYNIEKFGKLWEMAYSTLIK